MIDSAFIDALQIHATSSYALRKGTSGFGSPTPRRESTIRPRRHGENDQTRFYAGRVFNLRGYAKGATSAAAWAALDALKAALALGDVAHVLKFTRSGVGYTERALVRVASELVEDELGVPSKRIGWTVQLVAADPRIYADVQTVGSYDPSTTAQLLALTNGGNYPTPAVYVVSVTGGATMTAPAIVKLATGERLAFSDLLAGTVLTIDVDARTVLDATGTPRLDLLTAAGSTWFDLPAGGSSLLLTGGGFGEATTNLITNGGFETNTTGWGGTNWTLARDAGISLHGAASCKITPTANGGFLNVTGAISGATTGRTFTASVWIYATGAAVGKTIQAELTEFGGVNGEEVVNNANTVLVQGWQRLTRTGPVARNDRTGLRIYLVDVLNALNGVPIWLDGGQIEEKNHATAYLETNGATATRSSTRTATLSASYRDARI